MALHRRSSVPSLRSIEQQMIAELAALIRSVGHDPKQQELCIAEYAAKLAERHPDWQAVLDRDRQRRVDRLLNPQHRQARVARHSRKRHP